MIINTKKLKQQLLESIQKIEVENKITIIDLILSNIDGEQKLKLNYQSDLTDLELNN
jgi:hypothetical protein